MKKVALASIILLLLPLVFAEDFTFKESNDNVEINEPLGNVVTAITASHLSSLKSTSLSTQEGNTEATQYLRFSGALTAIDSPVVLYTQADTGDIDSFLFVDAGTTDTDTFFEHELKFSEGLKSEVSANDKLSDFSNVKFFFFADEYTIVDTVIDTADSSLKLIMSTNAVSDFLRDGETKKYTLDSKEYAVEVLAITANPTEVRLKVDGQDAGSLEEGEVHELSDGGYLGIRRIIKSEGSAQDMAEVFVASKLIEFEDNYNDDTFEKGVHINKQTISDGFLQLKGSVSNGVFSLSSIKYRAITADDIYLLKDERLSNELDDITSLLGEWDIRYNGLESVGETDIDIEAPNDQEYRLTFTNNDGDTYTVPFIDSTYGLGDATKRFNVVEGSSDTDFRVQINDYLLLSSGSSKTSKSYILQYDSVNTGANTVTFDHIGKGTINVVYESSNVSGALGQGILTVGDVSARFYVENATTPRLSMDLNGDSTLNGAAMDIITQGGAMIDLGTTNNISFPYTVTVTTDSSDLEESSSDEQWSFQITTGATLGINPTSFSNINMSQGSNEYFGMSQYGALLHLTNTDNANAEELTIDYPLTQRFASVTIILEKTSLSQISMEETQTDTCTNGVLDGDETAIDCGGSCPSCVPATCTNGIKDGDEQAVDCGGSCPDACIIENTTTQETPVKKCAAGCEYVGEEGQLTCVLGGQRIENLYCTASNQMVEQKDNGQVCLQNYECKSNLCEDGSCGKKYTAVSILMNIGFLVLLGVLGYLGYSLLKSDDVPDEEAPSQDL